MDTPANGGSSSASFSSLPIDPRILSILTANNFINPTPIQAQSIPVVVTGVDLVGIAQTGTGKTLAFGIPLIQHIIKDDGLGLIVAPTRELALQIEEVLIKITRPLNIGATVLIGGTPMGPQIKSLSRRPRILITTPGRLIDHLEQKTLSLKSVSMIILDEADRMLDMGFAPQISKIFAALPAERQTVLFSATMPSEVMVMASKYMKSPTRVEVAPAGTTAERVTQEMFFVHKDQKIPLLLRILGEYQGSTLVFSRTKHGAKRIVDKIKAAGISAAEIHSNRSLGQRRAALEGFKRGTYRVLVATDIAARGIDVSGIELVLNFDLPSTSDDYVHRIGRTARAGKEGHAISFAMPDQKREVLAIERLIRSQIPVSKLPEGMPAPILTSPSRPSHRNYPHPRPYRGRTSSPERRYRPRPHRP